MPSHAPPLSQTDNGWFEIEPGEVLPGISVPVKTADNGQIQFLFQNHRAWGSSLEKNEKKSLTNKLASVLHGLQILHDKKKFYGRISDQTFLKRGTTSNPQPLIWIDPSRIGGEVQGGDAEERYWLPDRIKNPSRAVSAQDDLYALGVVLSEMLLSKKTVDNIWGPNQGTHRFAEKLIENLSGSFSKCFKADWPLHRLAAWLLEARNAPNRTASGAASVVENGSKRFRWIGAAIAAAVVLALNGLTWYQNSNLDASLNSANLEIAELEEKLAHQSPEITQKIVIQNRELKDDLERAKSENKRQIGEYQDTIKRNAEDIVRSQDRIKALDSKLTEEQGDHAAEIKQLKNELASKQKQYELALKDKRTELVEEKEKEIQSKRTEITKLETSVKEIELKLDETERNLKDTSWRLTKSESEKKIVLARNTELLQQLTSGKPAIETAKQRWGSGMRNKSDLKKAIAGANKLIADAASRPDVESFFKQWKQELIDCRDKSRHSDFWLTKDIRANRYVALAIAEPWDAGKVDDANARFAGLDAAWERWHSWANDKAKSFEAIQAIHKNLPSKSPADKETRDILGDWLNGVIESLPPKILFKSARSLSSKHTHEAHDVIVDFGNKEVSHRVSQRWNFDKVEKIILTDWQSTTELVELELKAYKPGMSIGIELEQAGSWYDVSVFKKTYDGPLAVWKLEADGMSQRRSSDPNHGYVVEFGLNPSQNFGPPAKRVTNKGETIGPKKGDPKLPISVPGFP